MKMIDHMEGSPLTGNPGGPLVPFPGLPCSPCKKKDEKEKQVIQMQKKRSNTENHRK